MQLHAAPAVQQRMLFLPCARGTQPAVSLLEHSSLPRQVINNHHLQDREKQAAPWEWLTEPKQKYKEPKAGHFTRIQALPAFDLVRGGGEKKVRIAMKSLVEVHLGHS